MSVQRRVRQLPFKKLLIYRWFMCCVFAGLRLALHPTQALGPLVPAAAPPHSALIPATPLIAAPSRAAAPGGFLCISLQLAVAPTPARIQTVQQSTQLAGVFHNFYRKKNTPVS